MNVFIACPERTVTGGVELLHQLCHELDKYDGVDAFIWCPFSGVETTIPKVYAEEYKNRTGVPDIGDVVIFPEIWAQFANNDKFRNVIYWESVDNAPKGLKLKDNILHLAQSAYAYDYLQTGFKIPNKRLIFVTDYINRKFMEPYEEGERLRLVLYNPAKGLEFTKKIMKYAPDIAFMPITKLTTNEVIDLMRHSMVYIDFGNHPGKDRLPREAAMCGCLVITGRNGSANYYDDVSIPEQYKFERCEIQLPLICNKIRDIFDHYDEDRYHFSGYKNDIKHEYGWFSTGVRQLVERLKK